MMHHITLIVSELNQKSTDLDFLFLSPYFYNFTVNTYNQTGFQFSFLSGLFFWGSFTHQLYAVDWLLKGRICYWLPCNIAQGVSISVQVDF